MPAKPPSALNHALESASATRHDHPPRRRRWLRRLAIGAPIGLLVGIIALWWAVDRLPWLGPALADGLRGIVGTERVAKLEELAYGVRDRWNRLWRRGEPPKAYWTAPSPSALTSESTAPPEIGAPSRAPSNAASTARFQPRDIGPLHSAMATPGDGIWVPVADPARPGEPPLLFKTLIHPDAKRPWAELFAVAIDARRVRVAAMAGSEDPEATVAAAQSYRRPAVIPDEDQVRLVVAFNGGFKTEHGHYGMRVDGVTLVAPRPSACTVAGYSDSTLKIARWESLAESEAQMLWWRQTPPCLVQQGKLHAALPGEERSRMWGAAIGGDTVIRRSAIGLSADGSTIYVTVTNSTTARVLAAGMRHLGAFDAAQLDVNWSFPKVLVFRRAASVPGRREAEGLFPGFVFHPDDYIRGRSRKDFFYVVRRAP